MFAQPQSNHADVTPIVSRRASISAVSMLRLEKSNQKQASWRTDPKRSGAAGCFGDIGTHAYNLSRFITGYQYRGNEC